MFNLSFNFLRNFKNAILPFYKNKELKFIFQKLQEGSSKEIVVARYVGGCVRKHLSGEKIDDIDVATILTTDQIKNKFKDTRLKILETGLKHGTVTIVSKNFKVELTTLRKDIKTDGRHAEVEYIDNWKLDSERRDFTINAIYLDVNGKVFDPQMGTIDLRNKNVKFIGDPQKRIEEDFLRIIRFVRFKIMYDPIVELTTSDAIKQNLDGIKKISKERILQELLKILELKEFLNINDSLRLKEIFSLIFPEFIYLDRLTRLKKVSSNLSLHRDIILAVLLIDEKDNHEYFFHKYKVSNEIQKNLSLMASNLDKIKKNKNFLEKDLLKNVYIYGKEHLIALNLVNFSINSKFKTPAFIYILKQILKFSIPKFHIDGEYLKQHGIKEGKMLGQILKTIEKEWVENNFKIKNDRIKEIIITNSN